MRTKNNDEAATLVEEFMTKLPNGIDRKRVAERLFGSGDLGILGSEGLAKLRKYREDVDAELSKLPPDAEKNAIALEQAFDKVGTVLRSIRDAVGSDLAGQIKGAADAFGEFFKENRVQIANDLSAGFTAIATAIKSVPWADVGKGFLDFLQSVENKGGAVVRTVRDIGKLLDSLQSGNWRDALGALRRLDGANGPLARTLAPQPGDAEAGIREKIETTTEQRDLLKDLLSEAEGMGDKAKSAQLREALAANSAKLKDLQDTLQKTIDQGATVQQQSFNGGGGFGGLIQRASLGGSGVPRLPLQRGGVGGGGEGGAAAPGVPGGANDNRSPFRVSPEPGGAGERVGRAMRGLSEPMAVGGANPGAYKDVLDHIARSEGTAGRGDYNASLGYGRFLPGGKEMNLTGMTLDQISELGRRMRSQPGNPNSSALGRYQIVGDTMRRLMKRMGLTGKELFDEGMQDRMAAELARDTKGDAGRLGREWASLRGQKLQKAVELMGRVDPSSSTTPGARTAFGAVKSVKDWSDASGAIGAPYPPNWNSGASGAATARSADGIPMVGRAPGDSMGGRAFGADSADMLDKARRAGVAGGGTSVNGSVSVTVEKPGPDTRVKADNDGELFREVKLNRARSMSMASQVA
jgi:muramidase (phage lysozyme)